VHAVYDKTQHTDKHADRPSPREQAVSAPGPPNS
jgi:hypothetical protein